MSSEEATAARSLLSAAAVRSRAHEMLAVALGGDLEHWTVDLDRLEPTAQFVAGVIRDQYPDLNVPFHARWRHFMLDGRDLWLEAARATGPTDAAAMGRAAFDLAITSVLLDAGAGPSWMFDDPAGVRIGRSEGLALASLRLFEAGLLSTDPGDPLRADASVLAGLEPGLLGQAFQATDANPLLGLDGRAALLNRLGAQALARPDLFARRDRARPGGLFDVLADEARANGGLPAAAILDLLLDALGPIWEGRLSLGGVPLGDCWRHPAIKREDPTDGLVPIHKLSQWLSYSLIEPLQAAGIEVVEIDGLTGLAEYRNGGLLLDQGVLVLRHPADLARPHEVSDPLVVAWRSLTVALLDRLADPVRAALGVQAADFPLARMLEGGTWAAGRRIAAARRNGGGPPLNIISDGTVF